MEHALLNWCLAVPYVGILAAILTASYFAGGTIVRLLQGAEPGTAVFLLLVRIAAGLGVISFSITALGVSGFFNWPAIAAVLLPVITAGFFLGRSANVFQSLRAEISLLRTQWFPALSWARKTSVLVAFGTATLMSVNSLVGALAPDMGQDGMWYHLSVPLKWTFTHRFVCLPGVMPSSYPMSANALYAAIMLLRGNEVHCSLLYSAAGIMTLWAGPIVSLACSSGKEPAKRFDAASYALLFWTPVIGAFCAIAPIPAHNDMITALWLTLGISTIWIPILGHERPASAREWIAGGAFLGFAISAKLTVIGFAFAGIGIGALACFVLALRGRGRTGLLRTLASSIARLSLCALAIAIAYVPWAIRSWESTGLPLFPLSVGPFTVVPEFRYAFNASKSLNSVAAIFHGNVLQWMIDSAALLQLAAACGEYPFFLFGTVAFLSLILGAGVWRFYGMFLTACFLSAFLLKGHTEIFRYQCIVYALAAPAVGMICCVATKARTWILAVATVLIWFAMLGNYALRQYRSATLPTIHWTFRPMLSDNAKRKLAGYAEKGQYYLMLSEARDHVPPDALVLMPDCNFPYYLKRNMIWNDDAVTSAVGYAFLHSNRDEAIQLLSANRIDMILLTIPEAQISGPIPDLLKAECITAVGPKGRSWSLFRVRTQARSVPTSH